MRAFLAACAAQGRWLLVAGLTLGIVLPPLARAMAGTIVPLIALLLFLAALRIAPAAAFPARAALPRALALTLALQGVAPLALAGLLWLAGWLDTVAGTGAVLALAASPMTGTVGLAVMMQADASTALRQLVLGTALLPLTAAPVFAFLPMFDDAAGVLAGSARLLVVIAVAGGMAAFARARWPALTRAAARPALDGIMALVMGLVVVGLMAGVGPALRGLDPALPGLLAMAFALNLFPALTVWRFAPSPVPAPQAAALAIAAANRNLALFLTALPPDMVGRLLLFVGLYQVPMYLTPLILPRLLRQERRPQA